ncbi:MAG: hypothetical protein H0V33_06990 [Acidimicrobiia bacterium]|nr:hypothetical protein [Acidimicrobiia bacterium]
MPAVIGPLQLDHHEPAGLVDREEVDPAPRVLPFSELLGDDQQVFAQGGDVVAQQPLEVCPLVHAEGGELGHGSRLEPGVSHLV